MEDIVQLLQDKAGLTKEQAIKSVEVLKEYIHGKVPPMFSGFVDNFFAKQGSSDSEVMP
jgi:hypothetical protein